ncbi:MAG: PAS domain S-box protein, partial [Burkholderiales bacterium]
MSKASGPQGREMASVEIARQYRLFEQAPGFIVIMNGPQHVVEFVNDAHRELFGSRDWVGKTMREAFPSIAGQGFFEILDRVYASGETFRVTAAEVRYRRGPAAPEQTRFLSFIYAPLYNEHKAVTGVFCQGVDVTETYIAEKHDKALAELGQRVLDTQDPDDLAYAAAEILGRTLGVSRAGYGTIDTRRETITIERDYNMPGIKSLAGVLQFRDYGSYIEDLKNGVTVAIADADKDPRTTAGADALKAISAHAFVNMPVTEQGGFVALLYLNHADAREWSDDEISLIREVAQRTRTAVERRRAEIALRAEQAELREAEERYRLAARATNDAIWDWRLADGHVIWNEALHDLFGYALTETSAEWWLEHIHPDDRQRVDAAIHAVIDSSETGWSAEYRFRRADDKYASVFDRGHVLRDENGQAVRMIGAILDLTERRRAEDRLRELNADLERQVAERTLARGRTWQLTPDLLGVLDAEGRFEASNPAWQSVLGWSEEEMRAFSWRDLVHPDDVRSSEAAWAEAAEKGLP